MSESVAKYVRRTATLPGMSHDEVLAECRAKENDLIDAAADLLQIAEALWPAGESERPADMEDAGVTADQVVAGIKSLHEYCERVLVENDRLRERLGMHHG